MTSKMTIEKILKRDGMLVYKTRGVSMRPMLRENRDLVIIRVPGSRLKKYDVALYKRGKYTVLHRVIRVEKDHYLIRGDNTYRMEIVPDSAVIGVLSKFQRDGKEISVENPAYQWYARFWTEIYPLRNLIWRGRGQAVRCVKAMGLYPFLKRVLRKR